MKTRVLLLLILQAFVFELIAQNDKYVIYFKDKNGSPFSISNPAAFLSPRAIQRRVNQNIPIQVDDLPVNQSYINQVAAFGVTVLNRSKWFNAISIQTSDTNKINAIKGLTCVAGSQILNRISTGQTTAPYTKFDRESLLPVEGQTNNRIQGLNYGQSLNQIQMIGGDLLHDQGYMGQGMVIAVLDAGFTDVDNLVVFDSLRNANKILGTRDFVDGGTNVYGFSGHGTSVLSTMAANMPGTFIGTAPRAAYYLLRTEDVFSENPIEEFNWAAGVEFADSVGADVINSSLGYTDGFGNPSLNHTYADQNGKTNISSIAATFCARKGIVVVVAAGNEGSNSFHYISSPADADSILAIGAVNSGGTYVSFSSTGPSYDGRVKPNVAAQGSGTTIASPGGFIGGGSGTSFASPVTAGMVACLIQANPTKKCMEIIQGIEQSASQYNNPDSLLGFGIPNFHLANILISGIQVNDKNSYGLQSVFPNPFRDKLSILYQSGQNELLTIQLFDVTGKKVIESAQKAYPNVPTLLHLSIDNKLAQGYYLLRVISNDSTFERKVILN